MAVVSPDELDHLVPAGERAGEAQRAHHRLGPRIDEADHLHARHEPTDQPREIQLQRAWGAEARPAGRGFAQGGQDARVGMAQDERPPRQDIVDIAVSVHVVQERPLAPVDEQRLAPDRLERPYG